MYTDSHTDSPAESQLLHRLRQGDEKIFEYIFNRYYPRICLYAAHYAGDGKDAEDIAEESFLKIWHGNRDFQSLKHLKASLYQAARHIGLNHLQATQRRQTRESAYELGREQQETRLDQIIQAEVLGELYRAVDQLPGRARQIIIETYLEGKSNQEVADLLGLSLQTVKNQKLRALALLRKNMRRQSFLLLMSFQFIF